MSFWKMKTTFLVLFLELCIFPRKAHEAILTRGENRLEERGDVTIIAYLGIKDRSRVSSKECSKYVSTPGIMFFEALRYAIYEVNKHSSDLQKTSLGYIAINTCKSWWHLRKNVKAAVARYHNIGVIGPPTSDEAIFSAPILSVFNIPLISHSATSIDLEDREKYENFYRTVPSDRHAIQAFVDLLSALKWNFVSAIGSNGNYGQRGLDQFTFTARNRNICIYKRLAVDKNPTKASYLEIIRELLSDTRARAVVLFTSREDTNGLLRAAVTLNVRPGRLFWLGNTHFRSAITADVAHLTDGAIMLELDIGYNKKFEEYFLGLNPSKANYSWFHNFWEESFQCNIKPQFNMRRNCTGHEKLAYGVQFDSFIPVNAVINAVSVYACGFRKMIRERCAAGDARFCVSSWIFEDNATLPTEYMLKNLRSSQVFCNDTFKTPRFLKDGGMPANFRIINIQFMGDTLTFTSIGQWTGGLDETETFLLFTNHTTGTNLSSVNHLSSCSLQCKRNEIQIPEGEHRPCCWLCQECGAMEYVRNNTCVKCPQNMAPNHLGGCVSLPIRHVSTSDMVSIVTLVFCFVGIKLTTVVLGVYLKYWDSRIVKAAGKELSSVMIVGLYMCFITPIFFLSKPDQFICSVQRFVVGVSLTTCYTPLLLKTNRIYRIFKGGKNAKLRPSFISPRSQVLICGALISIQVLFGITWVVANPPQIVYLATSSRGSVTMICSESVQSIMLNLAICCVMMLVCTYFAFKTRKFPKNYNESRSIVLTMYLTCFVWGIFIPMFFFSKGVDLSRVYIVCVFCIVIAYVTLVGLFESRIRLLVFPRAPKEDDRSTSTGYCQSVHTELKITHIKYEVDYKDHAGSVSKDIQFDQESTNLDKSLDTEVDNSICERVDQRDDRALHT